MLRALQDVLGGSVIAMDGEMGKIRNFLFEDQSWMIRYLVVDVGHWLTERDVIIAVAAIGQPDWSTKSFKVNLTKEQVRNSPGVDSRKPVSRQQEIAMREYYGWPAYWDGSFGAEMPPISLPAGREFPAAATGDPNLRSMEDVLGYEVWANDGEIARLEHFIVDDGTWHIGYLDVKAGDWLHGRSMLIPTRWVQSVSWAHHRIGLDREQF